MLAQTIYDHYKIMPQLQLHMYRVAGVAALLVAKSHAQLDRDAILTTCLLHDMGNIVKFKLRLFPDSLMPRGLKYWQEVQEDYKARYGLDEHLATRKIVREIGVNGYVIELIDQIGFANGMANSGSSDMNLKICAYADQRVSPAGITSLMDRLQEGRRRYEVNKKKASDQHFFDQMIIYSQKIEQQIFAKVDIEPEYIDNHKVEKETKRLKQFNITIS